MASTAFLFTTIALCGRDTELFYETADLKSIVSECVSVCMRYSFMPVL